MSFNEFVVDPSGNLIEVTPEGASTAPADPRPCYRVTFDDGRVAVIEGADAFQPEGQLITFFAAGSARGEIDSWSTRIASYRAAVIASVERIDAVVHADDDAEARSTRLVAA